MLTISISYRVDRAFSNDYKGPENLLTENHILWTNELQNSIIYTWETMILNQISTTITETESGQLKSILWTFHMTDVQKL